VTERVSDDVDRYALPHELARVGAAEPVRVHALLNPGLACQPWQQVTDVGIAQSATLEGAEHHGACADVEGAAPVDPTGE
jgi:hypothetical protein